MILKYRALSSHVSSQCNDIRKRRELSERREKLSRRSNYCTCSKRCSSIILILQKKIDPLPQVVVSNETRKHYVENYCRTVWEMVQQHYIYVLFRICTKNQNQNKKLILKSTYDGLNTLFTLSKDILNSF